MEQLKAPPAEIVPLLLIFGLFILVSLKVTKFWYYLPRVLLPLLGLLLLWVLFTQP